MVEGRRKVIRTEEMPLSKVSVRKVAQLGEKVKPDSLTGWEYAPPEKGQPYLVYLKDGAVFRTSQVKEVERIEKGFVLRTENSIYEVRYISVVLLDKNGPL
jgi:hypothetical protein